MNIIPNKTRWKKWSLPAKFSYLGIPLAILFFIIGFIYTIFIKPDYSKPSYELIKKLESKNITEKEIEELIYRVEKELKEKINQDIWDEYAQIILSIYQSIDTSVIIKLNEKIFCDLTKKSRVIDLALHSKIAGHDILVAIKLLPIKEPLDIQVIEYYSQIIKDIKASKGVIICNGGFSREVIEYAKTNMIDLCSLKDASSREWAEDIAIPVIWKKVTPNLGAKVIISLEPGDIIYKDFTKTVFSNDNGKTTFTIVDYFIEKWNNKEIPHFTDSIINIKNDFNNLKFIANKNDWRNSPEFALSYYTQVNYYLKYFTPSKYKAIENYVTGDVQFSELEIGISPFKNDGTWISINSVNKNIEGLKIIITVNHLILNNKKTKLNYFAIEEIK